MGSLPAALSDAVLTGSLPALQDLPAQDCPGRAQLSAGWVAAGAEAAEPLAAEPVPQELRAVQPARRVVSPISAFSSQ